MNELFLTADTHFGHSNIIKYCNRPFRSVEEMDESYIQSWNDLVSSQDKVIVLGDFAFQGAEKVFRRLRGQKFLIRGCHDKKEVLDLPWGWVRDVYELKIGNTYSWLSHYPHRSWRKSFHGAFHFYGHIHEKELPQWGRSQNVGVDIFGIPMNFEMLKIRLESIPPLDV
jgi:calcineurin-like phosphoesterase family protein